MTSPPRTLKRSPPRRPLHERSDSHANEILTPTVRVIGDANAKVYASSPFPTLPSHILIPDTRQPEVVFEDDHDVSAHRNLATPKSAPANPINSSKGKEIAQPRQNYGSRPNSQVLDASNSFSPTSAEPLSNPPALVATTKKKRAMEYGDDDEERYSDEIIQLPSVDYAGSRRRPETAEDDGYYARAPLGRGDHPSSPGIASKVSHSSLSTNESTDTVIKSMAQSPPPRGSYSAFPQDQAAQQRPILRHTFSNPLRSHPPHHEEASWSPVSSASPTSEGSPVSPVSDHTPERHGHSALSHTEPSASEEPEIQYPIIHPPRASGSWAQASVNVPKRKSVRISDGSGGDRWTPQLSMIESEATGNRNSGSIRLVGSGQPSYRSSMAVDMSSSSSNTHLQRPQPTFRRSRDITGSTIRMVGEEEGDTLSDMRSPALRSQASGYLSQRGDMSRTNSMQSTGPGSRGSILRDSIPAWARTYYASEARNAHLLSPRPETANSNRAFPNPLALFRTRTRPDPINTSPTHQLHPQASHDSLAITPASHLDSSNPILRHLPHKKPSQIWSPHLWHDRRSVPARRSIFRAPSLDEHAEGKGLNRRSVQIWLFALGFVFPLAWWVASFLPLPKMPDLAETPPGSPPQVERQRRRSQAARRDLEKELGPTDLMRYENARWWRNLNRVMAVVGGVIIALVVALAVVATRLNR